MLRANLVIFADVWLVVPSNSGTDVLGSTDGTNGHVLATSVPSGRVLDVLELAVTIQASVHLVIVLPLQFLQQTEKEIVFNLHR